MSLDSKKRGIEEDGDGISNVVLMQGERAAKINKEKGDDIRVPVEEHIGEIEGDSGDDSEDEIIIEQEENAEGMNVDGDEGVKTYLPGQPLKDGEVLDYDPSAYRLFHEMNVEWPSLSFDILRDDLGDNREQLPATVYLVSGTQADKREKNKIVAMKISNLHRIRQVDSDGESDDDDIEEDPTLQHSEIRHNGGVNRIRTMPSENGHIVSTWADTGKVHIWDLSQTVASLDQRSVNAGKNLKPLFTLHSHKTEGFAMDWSRRRVGRLLTGDCSSMIHLTEKTEGGGWTSGSSGYLGHSESVEDLHWSPSEDQVFASASVDQTVKIWDTRMKKTCGLSFHAHDSDVNVISWNPSVTYLIASGSDSGEFRLWDMRNVAGGKPSASFDWHNKAITSIEWHPTDEAQLAVSGEDNQVTLWDFSVEKDDEEAGASTMNAEIPPQLMFIHQGQEDVKEIHWHRQVKDLVVTTAISGFNIFKTAYSC